jgi:sialidase-1
MALALWQAGNARADDPALLRTTVYRAGEAAAHTYRIPSLLVTAKGTLLAIAEARRVGSGDAGDVDLVVKRSEDQGRTWSDALPIWDDGANTCGNPCAVLDPDSGTVWLLMTWNRGEDTEPEIIARTGRDTRRVFVCRSDDDGRTWSRPREITAAVKPPDWTWYATGPGAGIRIEHGPHRGRLIIPCDHIEAATKRYFAHVIYSNDRGVTWRLGGSTPRDGVNECEVVEVADGALLLNARNYEKNAPTRQVARSTDGGVTWIDQRHAEELIEPICQASIRRLRWPRGDAPGVILFSNPASRRREKLTVRASLDDGRTWPIARLIEPGPSAYSCLARLPDGSAGLLYETGAKSPYERIEFVRMGLDGLLLSRPIGDRNP